MIVALRVVVFAIALASCATAPDPPDAPSPAMHDVLATLGCDRAWVDSGPPPKLCEYACRTRPTAKPCQPGVPCLDQPACARALDQYEEHDCSVTFLTVDDAGPHRGCCAVRATPGAMVPSFFECP